MAKDIVRSSGSAADANRGGRALSRELAAKTPAKHVGKKAAKKHPAKHAAKEAAVKHAKKTTGHAHERVAGLALETATREGKREDRVAEAFAHLNRAAALISLLEEETGGDLRLLLDKGVSRYRKAIEKGGRKSAEVAFGLLRAAEHLGMAGLFAARRQFVVEVDAVGNAAVVATLRTLPGRLGRLERETGSERLRAMAEELGRRAEAAEHDPHLAYELTMAAHWICSALERKLL